jgi:hypothetical protein
MVTQGLVEALSQLQFTANGTGTDVLEDIPNTFHCIKRMLQGGFKSQC